MKKTLTSLAVLALLLAAVILIERIVRGGAPGVVFVVSIAGLTLLAALLVASALLWRRRREAVTNLWLVLVSSVVVYVAVDVAAGALLIREISPVKIPDRYVHHKLAPNTTHKLECSDYVYTMHTNNLGFRGGHIEPARKPDVFRIVMLGDSFTMGEGVQDDETFSALLEKSLRAGGVTPGGRTIEVVNGGCDSYAPILSYFELTKEMAVLEPDLVVLNFDMSDLIQDTAYRNEATYDASGEIIGIDGGKEIEKQSLTTTGRARKWIAAHLYITRLVLYYMEAPVRERQQPTVENTVVLRNPEILRHTLADDNADRTEQWRNVFDSLLKIRNYCAVHDIDFLLTVYPWGHQVNDREWVPGRKGFIHGRSVTSDRSVETLVRFAHSENIEVLNVFPRFRSYAGEDLLYFKIDSHWTPAGHRLMAEALEEYMTSGLLAGRESPR